ncbi:uncharacterized protein LOC125673814 isoform X2 [Ostrea edulis]|uniref:uncharacterized protein LOC125673814 isoform X2 n=1 Tax=Ostrea edulis TaxID=37623 RepID=UPI00209621B0|nr:uncharacterized protein LOC125673814 isoform X2 [Ostrea edulis]XP_056014297.1 uncharacterized protein LOC125673814 isoform X2 [Ostrea edulis]
MAMLRSVFGGCVSDRSSETMRLKKLKFGAPISTALKNGYLPIPLMELLVYIAHEGMNTADLFRRPGNPRDTRRIVKRMSEGKPVIFQNYNLYTLTTVVKKFLLRIPGGIFGTEGEATLLSVLSLQHKMEQYEAVHAFLISLSRGHQQLVALLFGIWFTMINNSHVNFMTTEALARSVAGSMFHSCATDPAMVEHASQVMQILIENFGVASMFGQENIEFFAETTRTSIHIKEKFRYHFQYPTEEILPPITEESFYESASRRLDQEREDMETSDQSPDLRHYLSPRGDGESATRQLAASTISAPEVSLVPSPGVISRRPKSLEDNLNDTDDLLQPRPSLSRFNSVKRKQLERLRQRSDWFLGPNTNNQGTSALSPDQSSHSGSRASCNTDKFYPKMSGNSVTKASSEGTALDFVSSDVDSVFSDRSESPASEPLPTPSVIITRDIIHSDTITDVSMATGDVTMEELTPGKDNEGDLCGSEYCFFVVEHNYGDKGS